MTELSVVEEARQRAEETLVWLGEQPLYTDGSVFGRAQELARDVLALAAELERAQTTCDRFRVNIEADTRAMQLAAIELRDRKEALSVAVRRVETLEAALKLFFSEYDQPDGFYAPTDATEALMRDALAAASVSVREEHA